MNLIKATVLTGTALSLLLPLAAQNSALAQMPSSEQLISQSSNERVVAGEVIDIVGDIVTIRTDEGEYIKVIMYNQERGRLGLVPGMRVVATLEGRNVIAVRLEEKQVEEVASSDLLERVRQVRRDLESRQVQTPVLQQRTVIQRQTTTPVVPVQQPPVVRQQPAQPVRALW